MLVGWQPISALLPHSYRQSALITMSGLRSRKSLGASSSSAAPSNKALRSTTAQSTSSPSSFPKRAPLPDSYTLNTQKAQKGGQKARSKSTASKQGSSSSEEKDEMVASAGTLARKFTRFYTSNFEKRPVITLCVTNSTLNTIGDACAQLIPILSAASGAPVPDWDFSRSLRFAMFGFSLGPLMERWNRFLEHRFPLRPLPEVFTNAPSSSLMDNEPAFAEKLQREAEKEGFKVNIERGDSQQGRQYESKKGRIVDPQHVAIPTATGAVSVAALLKRVAADQIIMAPIGLAIFISTMAILEGLEWEEIQERYSKLYWPILLVNWQIWPIVQLINFRYLPLRYRVPFSASLGVLWTVFLSFRNAKAS